MITQMIARHIGDKRSEADANDADQDSKQSYQRRPRGNKPRAKDDTKNSGIQVIVSTSKDSQTMIQKWSKAEVSLPLCKGARSKQLDDGTQTGGYCRGKSSQSESKSTWNETFTKIAKETKGRIQNSGE